MHRSNSDRQPGVCQSLDDLIHVLGRAEILNILRVLAEGPSTCREISARLELEDSAISEKLGLLRKLGLVRYTQRKKYHIYRLAPTIRVSCDNRLFNLRITLDDGQHLSMASCYYGRQSDRKKSKSQC